MPQCPCGKGGKISADEIVWTQLKTSMLFCFSESTFIYPLLIFGGPEKGVCCAVFTFCLFFKDEDLKHVFHLCRTFRRVKRLVR